MQRAERIQSVRLSAETGDQLEALAKRVNRPQSRILREAIEGYIDREMQTIQRIEAAIEQADRGEVIPHDDVMDEAQRIINAAKAAAA
jgi:predicted transcriptional regulator